MPGTKPKTIIHPNAKLDDLRFAIYERAVLDYILCCSSDISDGKMHARGMMDVNGEKYIISKFLHEVMPSSADAVLKEAERLARTGKKHFNSICNIRNGMAFHTGRTKQRPKLGHYKKKGHPNDD